MVEDPRSTGLAEPLTPVIGQHVRLEPYIRGLSPRDTLVKLWQFMERCPGGAAKIFWTQQVAVETQRGDPESYMAAFSQRISLAVYRRREQEIVGHVWFENVSAQESAQIGLLYHRRVWGPVAREATALACAWAVEWVKVQRIFGITPFRLAVRHAEAVGFKLVGILPGFTLGRDVFVLCLEA
jgi:hypothetical protein